RPPPTIGRSRSVCLLPLLGTTVLLRSIALRQEGSIGLHLRPIVYTGPRFTSPCVPQRREDKQRGAGEKPQLDYTP
ncbi:unnamed protein product, partial [Ectocarpus sp. 4 AP-2014]